MCLERMNKRIAIKIAKFIEDVIVFAKFHCAHFGTQQIQEVLITHKDSSQTSLPKINKQTNKQINIFFKKRI